MTIGQLWLQRGSLIHQIGSSSLTPGNTGQYCRAPFRWIRATVTSATDWFGVKRANGDALDLIAANGNGVTPICRSSESLSTSVLMPLGDVRLLHLW